MANSLLRLWHDMPNDPKWRTITSVLHELPGLMSILRQRYIGKGRSLKSMAADLHNKRPEWCLRTCETRVAVWVKTAEFMLYQPMSKAFSISGERFSR